MKLEKVSGSQVFKRTCATCGKRHYGDCLLDTGSCFGCVKDGHMVKDCPIIAFMGIEGRQVPPNALEGYAPMKKRFYALRTRGSKPDEDGKSLYFLFCYEFLLTGGL